MRISRVLVISVVLFGMLSFSAFATQQTPTPQVTPTLHVTPTPQGTPPQEDATIVEVAQSDERFSTLVTALEAAGLVETLQGEGPYTVFAPTNEAFEQLPEGVLDSLLNNPEQLRDVLLYHVVEGEVTAEQVVQMDAVQTLLGPSANVRVQDDQVYINSAQVIETDIQASNGVIHAIDMVLMPPSETEMQSIVEVVQSDPRFDTLAQALDVAGLVETLQGEGPYTVFAPTDEAFDKLPEGTLDSLLNNPEQLRDILLYHVVEGEVTAEQVVQMDSVQTLLGPTADIRVQDDQVFINDAQVIETDIQASNGVIHAIDSVLMPPEQPQQTVQPQQPQQTGQPQQTVQPQQPAQTEQPQ